MKIVLLLVAIASFASIAATPSVQVLDAVEGFNTKPSVPAALIETSDSLFTDIASKNARGRVSKIRLGESKDLLKTIYSSSFSRFAQLQQQIPQGIFVTNGTVTLAQIAKRFPDSVEKQSEKTFVAHLPIIIDIGGALRIEAGQTLKLSANTGSFIHNSGELLLNNATLLGWDVSNKSASVAHTDNSRFRPFVIAFGGSKTLVTSATIASLGFEQSSSYGFTARTATTAALNMLSSSERHVAEQPPAIKIVDSSFADMFVGIYLDGASNSQIVNTKITNSRDTGLLVTNDANGIYIADNTVAQTKTKHGIAVSTGASGVFIFNNNLHSNARNGLLIDRVTSPVTVAFNAIHANRKDGIGVYESSGSQIYGNKIYNNQINAIRLRSSTDTKLLHNIALSNRGAAVYVQQRIDVNNEQTYPLASSTVFGGLMVENRGGAIFASGFENLVLGNLRVENNGSRPYRGELESVTADIILNTWKDNTAALVSLSEQEQGSQQ